MPDIDLEQIANTYFSKSMQDSIELAKEITLIAGIAEHIANTLLNNHKIICYGEYKCHALAQLLHIHLVHFFNNERPSLPALLLGNEPLLHQYGTDHQYLSLERMLQYACQQDDILLIIAGSKIQEKTQNLVHLANQAKANTIIICSDHTTDIQHAKQMTLNSATESHLLEMELLLINVLCHLIDAQLFSSG